MIISFASRYERVGKSVAMRRMVLDNMSTYYGFSFAANLNASAALFISSNDRTNRLGKHKPHPELGVSLKQVNHAISSALHELHPELPVFLVKEEIEAEMKAGHHVIIDDMRRKREFVWARDIAEKYNTSFHVIEIVPVGKQLEVAKFDTWTNWIEPCGYEVWADISRPIVYNDGSNKFFKDVLRVVSEL